MENGILKGVALGFFLVFVLIGLGGCSENKAIKETVKSESFSSTKKDNNPKKKADPIDKGAKVIYKKKAEDDIALLDKGKIAEIKKQFSEALSSETTEEGLDEIVKKIKQSGHFKKVEKTSIEENEGDYKTETTVEYSKGNIVFSIGYNKDNQINTLDVK